MYAQMIPIVRTFMEIILAIASQDTRNMILIVKMLMSVKKALLIVNRIALTPSVALIVNVNLDMLWMTMTEKHAKRFSIYVHFIPHLTAAMDVGLMTIISTKEFVSVHQDLNLILTIPLVKILMNAINLAPVNIIAQTFKARLSVHAPMDTHYKMMEYHAKI